MELLQADDLIEKALVSVEPRCSILDCRCPMLDARENPESGIQNLESRIYTPLTRRETQILQQIVAGKTNKEIARMFCRSQRTIEYHRNSLMRKLDAHSAAELVKQAIKMGLL